MVTIVKRCDELREALTTPSPHLSDTTRQLGRAVARKDLNRGQLPVDNAAAPGQQFLPSNPGPLRRRARHPRQNQKGPTPGDHQPLRADYEAPTDHGPVVSLIIKHRGKHRFMMSTPAFHDRLHPASKCTFGTEVLLVREEISLGKIFRPNFASLYLRLRPFT